MKKVSQKDLGEMTVFDYIVSLAVDQLTGKDIGLLRSIEYPRRPIRFLFEESGVQFVEKVFPIVELADCSLGTGVQPLSSHFS